jgi:hypothetical protein
MQFIRFLAQYLNNFPSHFLYTWDGSPNNLMAVLVNKPDEQRR